MKKIRWSVSWNEKSSTILNCGWPCTAVIALGPLGRWARPWLGSSSRCTWRPPEVLGTTSQMKNRRVVIVGGGFAGINCARELGNVSGVEVTLIDRRNHHLFQPLLYQVAMAGLSPADIAVPIRSSLSHLPNVRVVCASVDDIELGTDGGGTVRAAHLEFPFDYLVLAAGAEHAYFGHEEWEARAPGLKSL